MSHSIEPNTRRASVTRRAFLGSALVGATAASGLGQRVLAAGAPRSDKARLNIAGVGIGGQGRVDLSHMAGENIVALCDVDGDYAATTFADFPQARRYTDYRVMLEKEATIDAVMIATPDHLHAPVTMAALRLGKHVYCEKPLTRTIVEARTIARAAQAAGVATQMGNQGMAFEGNRVLDRWIAEGVIGPVREVHVWSDRPTQRGRMPLWWPQGVERPKDTPPVPPALDWDLWLGPAPFRPYHPDYVPFRWRGWWDFGTGGLGDMGIHNLAPVFSCLKLAAPRSVTASSTAQVDDSVPLASVVHYEFPVRGVMPALTLHWYDGGLLPARPDELEDGEELDPEDGILLVGERGKILVAGWGGEHPRLLGGTSGVAYQRPPTDVQAHARHIAEWIAACKAGTPTRSDFVFAARVTEAVLLGALCVRNGGARLLWDAENMKVTNSARATEMLHYGYRSGWTL